MIPLKDDNPTSRTPLVSRVLIAVNVAIFVYELALGPQITRFLLDWGVIPVRLTASLQGTGEPFFPAVTTLFTSTFLHGGWAHVLGNMWFLWIFGDNIEDRLGHGRFLLFYVAAGLTAGLIHYATDPVSSVPTVGASGAIAGVLGAYLVAFPRARVLTFVIFIFFIQLIWLPAIIVLGLWFLLQFFNGALALGSGVQGGVAWWAHIGGFVFGVIFMRLVGMRGRPRLARL